MRGTFETEFPWLATDTSADKRSRGKRYLAEVMNPWQKAGCGRFAREVLRLAAQQLDAAIRRAEAEAEAREAAEALRSAPG